MDPAAILRELRDDQSAVARTGLYWLTIGAVATILVMVMLSPAAARLPSLPDLSFGESPTREVATPSTVARPRLTAARRMQARRTAVQVAIGQVGVRERGVNGGMRIATYRRAVTGPGENPALREPWCADFVSWAWNRAGIPLGFAGQGADYVPDLVAWARVTRRWHWARDGYRPRSGDLIVYSGGGSRRGHIGLVVKTTAGRVHTVEGNLSDRVMRRSVRPWAPMVTGFISPA